MNKTKYPKPSRILSILAALQLKFNAFKLWGYEILSINHNCQSVKCHFFLLSSRSQVCPERQENVQNKDVQGMFTDNHS